MKIVKGNITKLEKNEVFVFGSNLSGRHGKGAAKQALKWGAIYGIGSGRSGNVYAIPTKDKYIKTLSIDKIKVEVSKFIQHAKDNPKTNFLVTEIGCGLAGYKPRDIAPLFKNGKELDNIYVSPVFWLIINNRIK